MKKERKRRKKKENNLGCTWETIYLVSQYRILKSIERGARKFSQNFDKATLEELNRDYKLAQDIFISYALDKNPSLIEDCFESNKVGIFASLYRILEKEDLLDEAIASLVCLKLNGNKNKDTIKNYASHLRYYLNHPEIHHEYKSRRNLIQNVEGAKPYYNKLLHVLENKGNLKVTEKEEIDKLVEDLKKYDEKFIIRAVVLEDFFNSEEGSKLSNEDKIFISLKVGSLDISSLSYYKEDGNLA